MSQPAEPLPYEAETRSIAVSVQPVFLEDQSAPAEGRYVWAYQVRIENRGSETVQLINRHWKITDAAGRTDEVRGAGVVGDQPVIRPGSHYEYTSGAPLRTPSGMMVGSYEMQTADGQRFDVAIPAFSLDSPHQAVRLN
ncbi:MAG: Co2+/Mg2+ efflux protein ApaG [Deinococcus-Thermus bacterium]|jgi:ApaG protein|nr:Co2+/Mg2+ efflux protein ApaG [Deinococcota bacterium]